MTAPQPATPGSDSVHAQLAEAVPHTDGCLDRLDSAHGNCTCRVYRNRLADILVPLVDRLRAEAKAEALEEAANNPDCFGPGVSVTTLRDRAAAYRTNPSSEETHRGE